MDHRTQQLLNEAQHALHSGNVPSARTSLETILDYAPQQIDALLMAAHIARAELQFDTARQQLKQVLKHDSITVQQLRILAQQLSQLELYFLLAECLHKLSMREPKNAKIVLQLGLSLARVGKIDSSILAIQKSITLDDKNPLAAMNLGHAFKAKGQSSLAAAQYQLYMNMQPSMRGTGYWCLADLKDYRFSTADILLMNQTIENTKHRGIDQKELGLLHFALARASEQHKNHELCFTHLRLANQKVGKTRPFKLAGYQQLVQSQLRYRPERISNHAKSKSSARPIFIIGMPRSGTTLVEQILASHTDISATDELPFIERIAMQLCKGQSYTQGLINMSEQQRRHFANYYLEQVEEYTGPNRKIFIDKNPTNFLHIALIKCLFPEARIIALLRDPLDNAMSVYKQHFSQGNDFSFDLSHIIDYTKGYYALLTHWQNIFSNEIILIRYQNLVTEPEHNIRLLLSACDVDFEAQCLEFYKSDRPVLTPSVSQVRQAITTKALGSGDAYLPFVPELKQRFEQLRLQMAAL